MSKLLKVTTGISGFDEITGGGLPQGKTTLICGGPGSGKTVFGLGFIYHGVQQCNEPGLFISFEETEDDIIRNTSSFKWDIERFIDSGQLFIRNIKVDLNKENESGEYNLEGLLLQLDYLLKKVKAKRIVLDTVEALFEGFLNTSILRFELKKLFYWLKEKNVTTIITGEVGDTQFNRHGLEEFISDCVILLENKIEHELSIKRLRIIKYRGSSHESNEFPYLIDDEGFSILPITSHGLTYTVSDETVSSGLPQLDSMFNTKGFYRGSSILFTGTAGAGKSSLVCQFVDAACKRSERCLYFAFEESVSQIIRNMNSIGIDLLKPMNNGLLTFEAFRPTLYGLEKHLMLIYKKIQQVCPEHIIIDPIGTLLNIGSTYQVKSLLIRLMDHLKEHQITSLFTELSSANSTEGSIIGISSLIDSWITLRDIECNGETNRLLKILKSRGMANSNQVREFVITSEGIHLLDIGGGKILTGTARILQEEEEKIRAQELDHDISLRKQKIALEKEMAEIKISYLRNKYRYDEIMSASELKKAENKKKSEQHVIDSTTSFRTEEV